MKSEDISRRSFLKRAAALSAAAAIPSFWIPSKANAMPGVPFVSANENLTRPAHAKFSTCFQGEIWG